MRSILRWSLVLLLFASACGGGSSGSNPNPGPSPDPANPSCTTGQRTFTITNNTGQQIWIGVTGGSLPCNTDADCPTKATNSCAGADPSTQKAGHCSCTSNSDCGSQAECNTNNNICFMYLPDLTTDQVNLPVGAHSTICMPAPVDGAPFQWSGNIYARTGCNSTGQNCLTGECGANSSGLCPTGTGGDPPNSLAEFTLSNQTLSTSGPDFYDVSIINGINVGVSMAPAAGTFSSSGSNNPYYCKTAGSTSAQGQLSACSWTINPTVPTASPTDQTTLLRDVHATAFSGAGSCPNGGNPNSLGYCPCTADSNCSSAGLLCGLATNAASGVQYAKVCGSPLGWWTADEICLSSNNTSPDIAAFNCGTSNNNLYSCTNTNAQSCYNSAAVPGGNCCGCATSASSPYESDWPSVLSPDFGGTDNGCYGYNNNWFSVAQPWIIFLKQACPTAYSYPFDDATSTFTCDGSSSVGTPNYNITFLPTQ